MRVYFSYIIKFAHWEKFNKDKIVLIDFFQNFYIRWSNKDINYLVKFVVKINLWGFLEMNNKITYHKVGDYYLPNLYLAKDEYEKYYQIGKYGHLRLDYLKTHKKAEYTIMFMDNTLRKHIINTDKQAKERFETLMKQLLEKNPIDENLKNTEPLKWIGLMNNYKLYTFPKI